MTAKLQGTCGVCLRVIQLRGDRPIRHGFSAVGVRHGQSGGYHTGPCSGTHFPHLGISTEGTQWAIDDARARLARTEDRLRELEGNPDITWYPKKYDVRGGRLDLSRPIVLKHGDEASLGIGRAAGERAGAPSYASEHRRRVVEQVNIKDALERAIAEYERVIATWSPEKYPTSPAPGKIETVHMATPRKNNRGETWTGILCRFTRQGYASDKNPKTTEPSEVTCKRCRAALGLPSL